MVQENRRLNCFIKVLGSAALAGLVAIVALVWSIYSSRSEDRAMEKQLANQATQIAKQDIQIALNAEQNRLLSDRATIEAEKAVIEDQLRTPFSVNNADFAPTATALAIQSIQIEATRQAIEYEQRQIETSQTAIAQPLPVPVESGLVDCGKFQKGETRQISSGTFVIGDVIINDIVQYDPDGTSEGTVAYFEGEGTVYAEWGAGCYRGNVGLLDEIVQGQFEFGCDSVCSTVRVVIVKANGQQEIDFRN